MTIGGQFGRLFTANTGGPSPELAFKRIYGHSPF